MRGAGGSEKSFSFFFSFLVYPISFIVWVWLVKCGKRKSRYHVLCLVVAKAM